MSSVDAIIERLLEADAGEIDFGGPDPEERKHYLWVPIDDYEEALKALSAHHLQSDQSRGAPPEYHTTDPWVRIGFDNSSQRDTADSIISSAGIRVEGVQEADASEIDFGFTSAPTASRKRRCLWVKEIDYSGAIDILVHAELVPLDRYGVPTWSQGRLRICFATRRVRNQAAEILTRDGIQIESVQEADADEIDFGEPGEDKIKTLCIRNRDFDAVLDAFARVPDLVGAFEPQVDGAETMFFFPDESRYAMAKQVLRAAGISYRVFGTAMWESVQEADASEIDFGEPPEPPPRRKNPYFDRAWSAERSTALVTQMADWSDVEDALRDHRIHTTQAIENYPHPDEALWSFATPVIRWSAQDLLDARGIAWRYQGEVLPAEHYGEDANEIDFGGGLERGDAERGLEEGEPDTTTNEILIDQQFSDLVPERFRNYGISVSFYEDSDADMTVLVYGNSDEELRTYESALSTLAMLGVSYETRRGVSNVE